MPNLIGSSYTHDHSVPPVGFAIESFTRVSTHKWIINNKVTKSKTHRYDVTIVVPTKSKTHKFNITKKVSLTKRHRYNAGGKVKRNKFHLWNTIMKLTNITHKHKFNIFIKVTKTKTHKYNVVGRIIKTKTHKWGAAGRIYDDAVKTHKFSILSKRAPSKTHKWNILTPQIVAADMQFYKSTSTNSLGGAINTSLAITDNIKANLFDTVTATESTSGESEFRCIYLKNISTRSILSNPKVWLVNDSVSSYSTIAIGVGTSAINGTEQTVATEETAPSGVTFTTLTGLTNALSLGSTISFGSHKAIWIRRTIAAGSGAYDSDNFTIAMGGDTISEV